MVEMIDPLAHAKAELDAGLYLVPSHMRKAIADYVLYGHHTGGFLAALLSNDLMTAATKADFENLRSLADWARFLHNYTPANCYGSREQYEHWIKCGGIAGLAKPEPPADLSPEQD